MAAWIAPTVIAGAKGIMGMWGAGQKKGAAQKAGREANQARVERGKKTIRMQWDNISHEYKRAVDTLDILKRNTGRQLDLADAESLRNWAFQEELRFDDYRRDVAAFNQSVLDYQTNLNLNDISANLAYEEEKQFMDDFYTQQAFEKRDDILEHEKILRADITSRFSLRRQQEGLRAKAAFEEDQDIIKGLAIKGQIRATGAVGRSARKAVQVAGMDLGARKAMRADAMMNANSVYLNEMRKLANTRLFAAKTRNLNIDKRAASLKSMLRASTLRKDKIAANKYSADLQAKRNLLPEPELGRMTPIPFEAFRPEFMEPTKPNKEKFYDDHMPHLEDENKIYGDRGAGAPGNPWMDALNIGLDMAGAAAGAGAFDGASSGTSGVTETVGTRNASGGITGYGGGSTGVGM